MGDKSAAPALRLASASPRRRQLLELIGVPHVVTPADIDETPLEAERADHYVMRLARGKADAVWQKQRDLPVSAGYDYSHVPTVDQEAVASTCS